MNIEYYKNMKIEEFLKQVIFYDIHCHTEYSNTKSMLDSIIKCEELINDAILKGYRGINVSDHECISGHVKMMNHMQRLHKEKKRYNELIKNGAVINKLKKEFGDSYELISTMPDDFKLGLGNEIYLIDEDTVEECKENYYTENRGRFNHMVLQALDEVGHEQIRELSSIAWGNHFKTGLVERVPVTRTDLEKIIGVNKGHIICSTACLGGNLGGYVLELLQVQARPHTESEVFDIKLKIHNFIKFCVETFGEDNFYIEVQPNDMVEQVEFNKLALTIAKGYKLPFIIATDTHYLNKEDRFIHKAYLTSRGNEDREVDDFYNTTYNLTMPELYEYWQHFGGVNDFKTAILNTLGIWERVEQYDLSRPEEIPQRPLPDDFEVQHIFQKWYDQYEYIEKVANSEYDQDRFFMHLLENGFLEKNEEFNDKNMARINEEFKQLWLISERLGQRMLSYYSLTELLINIMWDDDGGNSIVGISRGSGTGMFILYITNIIQINPIEWDLPNWRHSHSSRIELADIDIDSETTRRDQIFQAVSDFFEGKVLNLSTFKTEGSKSAVQTSARGMGIDNDISMSVSALIPFERGKHWSLYDCVYGNEEKEREPITQFINEINKYPRWLETAMKVEGLICSRSIHASGVVVFNRGITKSNAIMKAPNGKNITAFDMADSTQLGSVKLDFLTIDGATKLDVCMRLLIEAGKIEWQGSLRATYDKYLHPDVLEYNAPEMWKMVSTGELQSLFQFSTPIGITTAKLLKPTTLPELAHANSLMRLMGDGTITPTEKFLLFKNDIGLWYKEMDSYNLTMFEVLELEKHLKMYYGVSATQEDIMEMTMNEKLVGFDLTQANKLRKAVAKKSEKVMKEVRELYFKVGTKKRNSLNVLNYIWDKHIVPQLG